MIRLVSGLLIPAILAVGCSGDGSDEVTPAPTPVPTAASVAPTAVGVVLPPLGAIPQDQVERLRARVEAIVRAAGSVTTRIVQPDAPDFVADVAGVLAADETRLVCVLGANAHDALAALAIHHPTTRFCVDATLAEPTAVNLWAPRPRHREIARLVGVAAGLLAGNDLVAMVVHEGEPAASSRRAAFEEGHRQVALESDPAASTPPPIVGTIAAQDEDAAPIIEAILSQEPAVLVLDVGPQLAAVLATLANEPASPVLVVWADAGAADGLPPRSIIVARNELTAFRLALGAQLAGTFDELPETLGIAENLFTIRPAHPGEPAPDLSGLDAWVERLLGEAA